MPTTQRTPSVTSPILSKATLVHFPPSRHEDASRFHFGGPSWPPRTTSSSDANYTMNRHIMEPDEYFEKYTVSEMKTILNRLRSDVDTKQQELRLMVGERYRELLQASSSIISIADSSRRVRDALDDVRNIVSAENPGKTAIREPLAVTKDDSILKSLQGLGAHLKLLIDAPEHLWRLLEQKRYLRATWLFLLSRVVHRSLLREDFEDEDRWERYGVNVREQFPIAQRQWEMISHFRAQISHKASLSLRDVSLTPEEVCSAMLSLHLLDSLPMTDALDSFLKHRTRSLQGLLSVSGSSKQTPTQPTEKSTKAHYPDKRASREALDSLRAALNAIAWTVGTARDIFHVGSKDSPSLLVKVLAFLQVDSPSGANPSIPDELQLTTQTLLTSLPSSGHFSFLPEDITTYKPFIDLESPSSRVEQTTLESKLEAWMGSTMVNLRESTKTWLSRLGSIQLVWDVRNGVLKWLDENSHFSGEEQLRIRGLVDGVCQSRVQEIWYIVLDAMRLALKTNLSSLLKSVKDEVADNEQETHPVQFLLSSPQLPSASNISANPTVVVSSFERFHDALQRRVNGDTPILTKIIVDLESTASQFRKDSEMAFQDEKCGPSLIKAYMPELEACFDNILADIEDSMDDTTKVDVREAVILGRTLRRLSSSRALSQLKCSDVYIETFRTKSHIAYDRTVSRWRESVVERAVSELVPAVSSRRCSNSAVPSSCIINALRILSDSIQRWAYFSNEASQASLVKELLSAFVKRVSDRCELHDMLSDLQFLYTICAEWGEAISEPTNDLSRLIKIKSQESTSSLRDRGPAYINNVRFLLMPLLPRPTTVANSALARPPPKSPKSPKSPHSARPVSPPPVGKGGMSIEQPDALGLFGEETGPVMDIVKPTPRFGSLWVGSSVS